MDFVQHRFNRYRVEHYEALEECDVDMTNILVDDISRPVAECNLMFAEQLHTGLTIYDSFNEALCSSFYVHYECMQNSKVPFLMHYLMSRHEKFYNNFIERSCAGFDYQVSLFLLGIVFDKIIYT